MNNSKKIGIFGGTFDPPHIGHLIIAEKAREQLGLSKIYIMPTGNPGYKERNDISPKSMRIHMVKLAINNNPYFSFSDVELKREGIIYTSDTLQIIHNENPDCEIYFVMGGDSLKNILSWHEPDKIFNLCTLAVTCRDDISHDKLQDLIQDLKMNYGAKIEMLDIPLLDISSSDIRNMVKNGHSIKYYVTDDTLNYIKESGLYL